MFNAREMEWIKYSIQEMLKSNILSVDKLEYSELYERLKEEGYKINEDDLFLIGSSATYIILRNPTYEERSDFLEILYKVQDII